MDDTKINDIRVIAVDIHGTILPETKKVHELESIEYYQTVKSKMKKFKEYLKSKNIQFIVITGGGIAHAYEIPLKIGIQPDSYYCAQGALHSLDAGNTWRVSPWIKKTIRLDIKNHVEAIRALYAQQNVQLKNITAFDFIIYVQYKEPITKQLHEKVKNLNLQFKTYIIHENEHMITFKQNNKNQAIEHYSQTMNIPMENILFFGNSTNDLEALVSKNYKVLVSKNYVHFPEIDTSFKQQVLQKDCIIGKFNLVLGLFDYLNLQL